ncbi:MAG TPA: type II toxin-antitoxin system RatA family toxin [Steroidobacteraceae bacterium]|jgi:ribosome-associated toxin RatA of RatAB toxin-antitoxin module
MREVRRTALIGQTPERMFALINDIESYPQFLPWCTSAHVQSRTDRELIASIGVRRGPLNSQFTTRNELTANRHISMRLVSGPFKTLEGDWTLTPVEVPGQPGCRVDLVLRFAFANRLAAVVFEPLFEDTAASLVDAFVARARALAADGH